MCNFGVLDLDQICSSPKIVPFLVYVFVSHLVFFYFPANLGGQMGLFLGASVLTATELVEFLLLHLLVIVHKLKRPFTGTRVETLRPEK